MNLSNASPDAGAYTLVFGLNGLDRLEAVMGAVATASALEAMQTGIHAIVYRIFEAEGCGGLTDASATDPPGVWRAFGRDFSAYEHLESPEERREVVRVAATQLAGELAREIFGSATARLVRLRVVILSGEVGAEEAKNALNALDAALPAAQADPAETLLPELLESGGLRTFLQPLVHFPEGRRIGYEALSRGPAGSALERADQLFDTAARMGLTRALEIACAKAALPWAARLPAGQWLSINLSSLSLEDAALRRALARPGIIVELTEHLPLGEAREILRLLNELRAGGAQFALDDTGCGFFDLEIAQILKPDFIKLCITIIRSVGRHPESMRRELAKSIAQMQKLGVRVLAEGVENAQEAELLSGLGIDYAQGWHYGRPQIAEEALAGVSSG